jgi:flagellar biogenesis protein FliO
MEGRALQRGWHIPRITIWTLALALSLSSGVGMRAQSAAAESTAPPDPAVGANAELDTDAAVDRARRLAERFAREPASEAESDPVGASAAPEEARPLETSEEAAASSPLIEQRPLGASPDASGADDADTGLGGGQGWVLNTLTALGLVIGLVLLLRFGITKFGGRVATAQSRSVEVLSRTSVAPKNHVLLLRVGGRVLVVGDSGSGLRTLTEIEDPDEVASLLASVEADRETSMTNGFNRMLSRYSGAYSQRDSLADEGADSSEAGFDRARDSVSSLLGRVRAISGRGARE